MVVSSLPGEGKTTCAVLLAISLAALGRKILFIEADLRKPAAGRYLHLDSGVPGLSDYLTGNAGLEEVSRQGPVETLKVITAGKEKAPANVSELLSSDRFRKLLEDADQMYDRVVIDVPPVLYIPDGLIISKIVHTGVLVCGSGMVYRKTVKIIAEKFNAIHFAIIGAIINRADYSKEHHYYNSYYSYYYPEYKKHRRRTWAGLQRRRPADPVK